MSEVNEKQIQELALRIVSEHPDGIRYATLVEQINAHNPGLPHKTIGWYIWNLPVLYPKRVHKPERGLFVPLGATSGMCSTKKARGEATTPPATTREVCFYGTFADWLKNDLDEATEAIPLGGDVFRKKWSTPDVVGVYRPSRMDLIRFKEEIISAEIKVDAQQPMIAFGQAVAYRLFSARTYIAMPRSLAQDDHARLEALCVLFGIGLVLFELDEHDPNFQIRVRAHRFCPDMFYVNQFAHALHRFDQAKFKQLFG